MPPTEGVPVDCVEVVSFFPVVGKPPNPGDSEDDPVEVPGPDVLVRSLEIVVGLPGDSVMPVSVSARKIATG